MSEVKYRHEYKYPVTDAEIAMLRSRLRTVLRPDPYVIKGMYNIRSLYFDDYDDRCFKENEDGTDPREKFRIRIYNHSTSRIALECKRKEHGKTLKTSCPLSIEQARQLVQGEYLRDIAYQPPVLKKLTYAMMTRCMRPVVIVEYDRIPYVYKDGNVRITFDINISSSEDFAGFLGEEIGKRQIMPVGRQLMEVKFDEFLPDHIYRTLQLGDLRQTSFSKYYLCRKYEIKNNRNGDKLYERAGHF
ncbi:MAG: polyphosphate polymerase domain-containing protein [Clostridia bacterium]|nr:polyphosphate polymerase domain-containing protein [Clostridia bacterium]